MGHFFPGFLRKIYCRAFNMDSFKGLSQSCKQNKELFSKMSIEEKRKLYQCGDNYVLFKDIDTWSVTAASESITSTDEKGVGLDGIYKYDKILNEKISIYKGDITSLEIDSIVNAANSSLLGGGGVDGAIHKAAGTKLFDECKLLNGCKTGEAKITSGYKLPAKYIIHTVGPKGEQPSYLESCYTTCLNLAVANRYRTIAFPCISTGVYGYPNEEAAKVALTTVRTFLESNSQEFDRIIFCLFMDVDIHIYKKLLSIYFPVN